MNRQKVDWLRILYAVGAMAIGGAVGWLGQPLVHGNSDATGVLVNTFSILAGFLIAVMTILGEPSLYRGRSWRSDAVRRSNVYNRLVRQRFVFHLYLTTLGLIFLSTLLSKVDPATHLWVPQALLWTERLYLGAGTFAFLISFKLPTTLMAIQIARFEEMVSARRQPAQRGGDDVEKP